MKNILVEYIPTNNLKDYIDSFWFSRNNTGEKIFFPVVPDGCSDIIYYLNNSKKLSGIENTFISGIMEFAELIPTPNNMNFFGIRFKPGVLSFFLETDMSKYKNKMCELSTINKNIFKKLIINKNSENEDIIASINIKLTELLSENIFKDNFFKIMEILNKNPEITINKLSLKSGYSIKYLERTFIKRIGISPKKFACIMRFQTAHQKISKEGLLNLLEVALDSGYFDQAHFNREYKKLVGYNPNNETMSILYNT